MSHYPLCSIETSHQTKTAKGNPELDIEIAEADVLQVLGDIKAKKSPGCDGMYGVGVILKLLAPVMTDYVCRIFNDCLVMGYFPKLWKRDKLPELGKVFGPVIRKQLDELMGENPLYHP